jgi:predicted lipoprotein with Yx(FWY)xxD motif
VTGLAAKVSVANIPALGSVLVDNTGMPLYMSKSDKQNGTTSACDLTCIQTWVPLITVSAPVAGEGADASMLGTITLKSGLLQVTYNGWPLYHYLPDASLPANQRGQASGQGFQGRFVMGPDGNAVSTLLPTAAATAGTGTATP